VEPLDITTTSDDPVFAQDARAAGKRSSFSLLCPLPLLMYQVTNQAEKQSDASDGAR
jgi:hypothetical protein